MGGTGEGGRGGEMSGAQVRRFLAEVQALIDRQRGLREELAAMRLGDVAHHEKMIQYGLEMAKSRFLAILEGDEGHAPPKRSGSGASRES